MDIELKEKILVTPELLNELASKGWQEIEYLQAQLNNLDNNQTLKQLLQNLITSYYVFVGGLENLQANTETPIINDFDDEKEFSRSTVSNEAETFDLTDYYQKETPVTTVVDSEPFEYFVDFDEPIGEPISDEDLYGAK